MLRAAEDANERRKASSQEQAMHVLRSRRPAAASIARDPLAQLPLKSCAAHHQPGPY
jgi:hypothetical protein